MSPAVEVVHIALGGTISMRRGEDGLASPAFGGAELAARAGISTTPVELASLGGPQLTFTLLVELAAAIDAAVARGVRAIVVTLGTDAIEEVGAFLAFAGPWGANVVLTGAMELGDDPDSDGPANLADAAAVARGPQLGEPVVVFASQVTLARATLKISGSQLDAFASPTQPAWGVAQVLADGQLSGAPVPPPSLGRPGTNAPEVPILVSALSVGGSTGPAGTAALGCAAEGDGPATRANAWPALVCMASGAGNLTAEVLGVVEAALAQGTTVVITTRALDRRMSAGYGYRGGSGELAAAGAILAAGMSAHRARMFLLVALSRGLRGIDLSSTLQGYVDATSVRPVRSGYAGSATP